MLDKIQEIISERKMRRFILHILLTVTVLSDIPVVLAEEVFVACPPGKLPKCDYSNEDAKLIVDTINSPIYPAKPMLSYTGNLSTAYHATYKISGVTAPSIAFLCVPKGVRKPRCCTTYFSPHDNTQLSGGIKCNPGESIRIFWRNYSVPKSDADTTTEGQILITKTIKSD